MGINGGNRGITFIFIYVCENVLLFFLTGKIL